VPFNLPDIGRDEQKGTIGGATFGREHSRNGVGIERIHGQAVQRIGRECDNATGCDHTRGLVELVLTGATNTDSPHVAQLSTT
jgi:hypothetical protein